MAFTERVRSSSSPTMAAWAPNDADADRSCRWAGASRRSARASIQQERGDRGPADAQAAQSRHRDLSVVAPSRSAPFGRRSSAPRRGADTSRAFQIERRRACEIAAGARPLARQARTIESLRPATQGHRELRRRVDQQLHQLVLHAARVRRRRWSRRARASSSAVDVSLGIHVGAGVEQEPRDGDDVRRRLWRKSSTPFAAT